MKKLLLKISKMKEMRIFYGGKEEVQKIQHVNFSANRQVYSTYVIQCDVVFIHALAPVNFR